MIRLVHPEPSLDELEDTMENLPPFEQIKIQNNMLELPSSRKFCLFLIILLFVLF